jgi:hypothetical protein
VEWVHPKAFGTKLREETDLERISEDLVGMIRETMQPKHTSLWLCPVSSELRSEDNSLSETAGKASSENRR